MILLAIILVSIVLVVLYPFLVEWRRHKPDGVWKQTAPGSFVGLSGGSTHYQWRGPKKGAIAVCIHGLTTPSGVFEAMAESLSHMGFRVLTYDIYGRGYSDNAEGAQTLDMFVTQLEELLTSVGEEAGTERGDNLLLVGYSMGGMIATEFAHRYPGRIDRLVLLATAGLGHTPEPSLEDLRDRGRMGDWLMLTRGSKVLSDGVDQARSEETQLDGIYDYMSAQL
ncbi:MAG: alpha/beta fold hydrolase, partial [Pseudomonadota bacterium]